MPNDSLIQAAKEVWQLGMIELSAGNNEMEILGAAQAGQKPPPGWTLPALAVAIAAARSIKKLQGQIDELAARLDALESKPKLDFGTKLDFDNFDEATAKLTAGAEPGVDYEPDPEELEANYKDRLRKARALADAGAGWGSVVNFAFAGTSKTAPKAVVNNQRPPTPGELRVIEAWLNRHAKRGAAL